MKDKNLHEGCIEQISRLFSTQLYPNTAAALRTDDAGRIRMDELELLPEVQAQVEKLWDIVTNENLLEITDFQGYKSEFLKLFGFGIKNVDYEADLSPIV